MIENTYIIAEAGVNHNGSLETALEMVNVAEACGADAVKFQSFCAEKVVTEDAPKAGYQSRNTGSDESQRTMLKGLELSRDAHSVLFEQCQKKQIEFLSTAFDADSLDFLIDLGMKKIKIPSGEITNLPYLRHVAKKALPVILSTGMANLSETRNAVNVLTQNGVSKEKITILHCTTAYPAPCSDVNLRCLETLRAEFRMNVGYSDHTIGDAIAIAAVAQGATVLEKHYTLDKTLPGPDHQASLNPHQLERMIRNIRNVELAQGTGVKIPASSEHENIQVARRSIVAKRRILQGERFSDENLTSKRPAIGISPIRWDEVIGRVATQDFDKDDLILL